MPSKRVNRRRRSRQKENQEKKFMISGEGLFAKLPAHIRFIIWEKLFKTDDELTVSESKVPARKPRLFLDGARWNKEMMAKTLSALLRTSPLIYNDQKTMMALYKVNKFRFESFKDLDTYVLETRGAPYKHEAFRSMSVQCIPDSQFPSRSGTIFDFASPTETGQLVSKLSTFSGLTSLELEFDEREYIALGKCLLPPKDFIQNTWIAGSMADLLRLCVESMPRLIDVQALMYSGYSKSKYGIHLNAAGCTYTGRQEWISKALSEDREEQFAQIVEQYRGVWRCIRRKLHEQAGFVRADEDERDKAFEIRMNRITKEMIQKDFEARGWGFVPVL